MSSEHGQAPIYKLDSDVLHEIFKINTVTEFPSPDYNIGWPADERDYPLPLTITYQTSHVCKQWRDIILQSSIIWGRCIDFDVMERWNPSLRSLVFERAKESFLSITALRQGSCHDPFFLDILAHQWGRIQQLEIFLTNRDCENVSLMELLCRPAPNMSFFRVASSRPITSIQHSANLFSNQAPSLIFLWCPAVFVTKTPCNTLHIPSSKLRYLNLNAIQTTARNLLETCLEMPFLEYFCLSVTFDQDGTTKDKLPQPYLPRLNKLYINTSSFDVYPLFMDQIILANGCSVHIKHTVNGVDQIFDEELDDMQNTLLRYSQSFLDSHQECTNISLRVAGDEHFFQCDDGNFAIEFTQATVNNMPYHLPLELHFRLLDNICCLKFPASTRAINELYIVPGYFYSFRSRGIIELPDLWPPVTKALDSMEWISHITLSHTSIQSTSQFTRMVLDFCLARHPSFTSLTISAIPSDNWLGDKTFKSALLNRHKCIPFQLITLNFMHAFQILDLRFMNSMPGLTVTWTICESRTVYHKCGVDDPEQLYIK